MKQEEKTSPEKLELPDGKSLILFDGYCNLCNGAVQFVLKRDRKKRFLFAALSWPAGEQVIAQYPELEGTDSMVVYTGNRVFVRSSAALYIATRLGGLWPLIGFFWIIPAFIRHSVYAFIARRRYAWFGKEDTCMMPEEGVMERFVREDLPAG